MPNFGYNVSPQAFMVNPMMPQFITNAQGNKAFDPRLLDQNKKMMQMMAQNAKKMNGMYPNTIPMLNPMQFSPNMMINPNFPLQRQQSMPQGKCLRQPFPKPFHKPMLKPGTPKSFTLNELSSQLNEM